MDFKSQEIPDDVPFEEYDFYIIFGMKRSPIPISEEEWGEFKKKEYKNSMLRIALLNRLEKHVKEDGWTEHWLWIKEIIKKGYDLDIPHDERVKLFSKC